LGNNDSTASIASGAKRTQERPLHLVECPLCALFELWIQRQDPIRVAQFNSFLGALSKPLRARQDICLVVSEETAFPPGWGF